GSFLAFPQAGRSNSQASGAAIRSVGSDPYTSTPTSSHILVCVDDLAPGRKPYALMLLHMRDGALEIFDPQRLARDHGMPRKAHDTRLLAAVGIKRIELVEHRPQILVARVALADVERDVIDLVAVGDPEHLSRFHFHRIGLIVVIPVAAIIHALFGENIERFVG